MCWSAARSDPSWGHFFFDNALIFTVVDLGGGGGGGGGGGEGGRGDGEETEHAVEK